MGIKPVESACGGNEFDAFLCQAGFFSWRGDGMKISIAIQQGNHLFAHIGVGFNGIDRQTQFQQLAGEFASACAKIRNRRVRV